MTDKLNEFNSQLKALLDERFPNALEVFKLGVEVGRELQLNNINNYTMSAFVEREAENKKWQELVSLNRRIETLLKKLIVLCIGAYIKEHNGGSFEVEKRGFGYSECDKWSEEVANLFGVAYSHADMETYGGEFEMELNATSWLSELNEKYNLPNIFKATLSNSSGEEYEYIGCKEDAESGIWSISTMNAHAFSKMSIQQIEQYISELDKQVMFLSLKYD
jgi:hypothetical protein